jgi:hypothetical protein
MYVLMNYLFNLCSSNHIAAPQILEVDLNMATVIRVIRRGRRREHSMNTSEGFTWPSVTTGVAQLPVAHAHTKGNPEGVQWPLVTSGNHVTTTKKKNAGKSRACTDNTRNDRRSRDHFGSVLGVFSTTSASYIHRKPPRPIFSMVTGISLGYLPLLFTPREPRKGLSDLRSHPVAMVLLLRKKRGKKPGMRRTYFQSGTLPDMVSSGHVTLSLPVKRPL